MGPYCSRHIHLRQSANVLRDFVQRRQDEIGAVVTAGIPGAVPDDSLVVDDILPVVRFYDPHGRGITISVIADATGLSVDAAVVYMEHLVLAGVMRKTRFVTPKSKRAVWVFSVAS